MYEDILCLIPARKGSKGIPGKNKKLLLGIPLVSHSIQHAIDDGIPQRNIVVSSDDEDILEIAERQGVVPHHRPDSISGDHSKTEEAMLDSLVQKPDCSYIVVLQPTSPIRLRGRVARCIYNVQSRNFDSLVTATHFHNFCWYQNEYLIKGKNVVKWKSTYDYQNRPMRQDLKLKDFMNFDNGNIYITRREYLEKYKCRLGGKIWVEPISHIESIQIDDPSDFIQVEILSQGLQYCAPKYSDVNWLD